MFMKIKAFIFVLILTFTLTAFAGYSGGRRQKSDLPKAMPENTEMSFNASGGLLPIFKRVVVSDNMLFVEETTFQNRELKKWYAKISKDKKIELYRAFVENKFDSIKNEKQKAVVYDAPTETISIRAGGKSYNVSSGLNSPLSSVDQKRYQNVKDAIFKLEADYKAASKQISHQFAVIKYEPKAHSFIFKNAKAAELNAKEISAIDKAIDKAIKDYNSAQKESRKLRNPTEYKFQYVPVINKNNEKEVWVNAFCSYFENDWREKIISVDDGGTCFFNFKINLKTSKIYDFYVNGEA